MLSAFYSNRVEELYQRLKQQLTFSAHPFTRRYVVVPSPPLKSWLMLQLAQDPDLGIAAGLEITYPDERLKKWGVSFHSYLEFALAIEQQLRCAIYEQGTLWAPLLEYLGEGRRKEKRLIALSSKLAGLFLQYRQYGRGMIAQWEKGEGEGWQPELWRRLSCHQTFLEVDQICPNSQLHLFSISHLSPFHLDCFTEVSRYIPTHFYLLSPCQAFWSDIRTDRETRSLHAFWKAKGASEGQLEALDAYLRDCHPILANFGRLGREMVQQLEEREALSDEKYLLPASVLENPAYEAHNIFSVPSPAPLSLLEAVQADLLLMRNPTSPIQVARDTIQVHVADTRLRETQLVYDRLLQLMVQQPSLKPEEILVMAPDIMEYAPFIKMVFHESELDFHIMEAEALADRPRMRGFLQLLKLVESRWTVEELLELLAYPSFRKKRGIDEKELALLETWIRKSGIQWGLTSAHRDEVLKNQHCLSGMVEKSEEGTWAKGEETLLKGMIFDDPAVEIESTQAETLGKFLQLCDSLRQDIKMLRQELPLREWVSYLQCLFEAYFEPGEEEPLAAFQEVAEKLPEAQFPFATLLYHLEENLKAPRTSYRETHLHAVRFCPLLPMRTLPAKVIVLMGMQEGAFPRHETAFSLNLLKTDPEADYCPSKSDLDRYLFLEALLSARQTFIMTYQGYSQKDNKEQSASLLVQELLAYLKRAYAIEEGEIVFRHPFHSFDKSYFDPKSRLRSYSTLQYRLAQSFYHVEKEKPFHFIPEFRPQEVLPASMRLDIRELAAFAKNPLKVYFNKILGLYLPKESEFRGEEPFVLTHLDHYWLRKMALTKDPLSQIKLPLGLFKEVALKAAMETVQKTRDHLQRLGVSPKEIFTLELTDRVDRPSQVSETVWELPPLQIRCKNGSEITLVGKLEDVSPRGLITLSENKCEKAVEHLPQFLIYEALAEQLSFEKQLIFARSGVAQKSFNKNPDAALSRYLDYYQQGLKTASPLLPEWVPALLKGKNIEMLSYHQELQFLKRIDTIDHWKPIAEELFADLHQNWYLT